jgi:hypothetical protein
MAMLFWKAIKNFLVEKGALHNAAWEGNISLVKTLVKEGHNINELLTSRQSHYTPLGYSLLGRAYDCTVFLLEHYADPNIMQSAISLLSNKGKAIQSYLSIYVSPDNTQEFNLFTKQRNASVIR